MEIEVHEQRSFLRTVKHVQLLDDVESKYEVGAGEDVTITSGTGEESTLTVQTVDKESVYPSGGWEGEEAWLHPRIMKDLRLEAGEGVEMEAEER